MAAPPNPLASFPDARSLVERFASTVPVPPAEAVSLLESRERYLAEDVPADRDMPPFHRATRDGFAVRAADTASPPVRLRIAGELRAGASDAAHGKLQAGQAIEIMTGAALPEGADSVVMVEYTRTADDALTIERSVRSGDNWVPQGSEARAGEVLLRRGIRMNAAAIAAAAAVGRDTLQVYRKPSVAILATGDELVDISQQPRPREIRNSNSYSLAAQIGRLGGAPMLLPIARDERDSILAAIQGALASDLLLLSGGVSMGKYDLVEQVLTGLGAQFFFTGVAIQPGKPAVFGMIPRPSGNLPFFALPGNPVSTLVTFELFVEPVLRALAGGSPQPLRYVNARLKSEIRVSRGLTRFLPALLESSPAGAVVAPIRWQGSGDIVSVVRSNCYLVLGPDQETTSAADWATVLIRDQA